jgi:hypothetical protein
MSKATVFEFLRIRGFNTPRLQYLMQQTLSPLAAIHKFCGGPCMLVLKQGPSEGVRGHA